MKEVSSWLLMTLIPMRGSELLNILMNFFLLFLDQNRRNVTQLATMFMPSAIPEILSNTSGPFFTPQYLRDVYLLSALHGHSNTVSVHSMDIGLVPLYLYKIPKDCSNVLVTPNIMYTTQTIYETERDRKIIIEKSTASDSRENISAAPKNKAVNAIGVIGSNLTTLRIGEDSVTTTIQFSYGMILVFNLKITL